MIKVRFGYTPSRKPPAPGDVQITKKHGPRIRVFERHGGSYVVSNGRQCYVWRTPDQLVGTSDEYLLRRPEVRALLDRREDNL